MSIGIHEIFLFPYICAELVDNFYVLFKTVK